MPHSVSLLDIEVEYQELSGPTALDVPHRTSSKKSVEFGVMYQVRKSSRLFHLQITNAHATKYSNNNNR